MEPVSGASSFSSPSWPCGISGDHRLHLPLEASAEDVGCPGPSGPPLACGEQHHWLPTPAHPLRPLLPVCSARAGTASPATSQRCPPPGSEVVLAFTSRAGGRPAPSSLARCCPSTHRPVLNFPDRGFSQHRPSGQRVVPFPSESTCFSSWKSIQRWSEGCGGLDTENFFP